MRPPFAPAALAMVSVLAFGCAHMSTPEHAVKAPAPAGDQVKREAIAPPVKPKVTSLGEAPASVLFVGNSFFYYNNSMHGHFGSLVRAASPKVVENLRATSATISGSGMDWHDVEAYFKPAFGAYSFDAKNNVVFNKLDKKFDAAMVADCSQCPVHPQLKGVFHQFAKQNSEVFRKHGAKPVLFMTWAYEDKPEMTAQLATEYTNAGNANDALVVPAGLAFAKALYKRPSLVLYVADKRHPSLAGTYLAACTIFAAFYNRSPEGNSYTAGLEPDTARFLQQVAWETVREFYGK